MIRFSKSTMLLSLETMPISSMRLQVFRSMNSWMPQTCISMQPVWSMRLPTR